MSHQPHQGRNQARSQHHGQPPITNTMSTSGSHDSHNDRSVGSHAQLLRRSHLHRQSNANQHALQSTASQMQHAIRAGWKTGDACQIYSNSKKKWVDGKIACITTDGEGEWLEVRYCESMCKQVQRFSNEVRPAHDTNQHKLVGSYVCVLLMTRHGDYLTSHRSSGRRLKRSRNPPRKKCRWRRSSHISSISCPRSPRPNSSSSRRTPTSRTRVEDVAVGTLHLRECVLRDQRGAVEAVHEAEGAVLPVPVAVTQRALICQCKVSVVTASQGGE